MTGMNPGIPPEPPLFGTQGGGYARLDENGQFVWYELPDWMKALPDGDKDKAAIGDPIHPEWDLIPANRAGRDFFYDEDMSDRVRAGWPL